MNILLRLGLHSDKETLVSTQLEDYILYIGLLYKDYTMNILSTQLM